MTNKKIETLERDLSFVYQRQDNVNFGADVPVSEHEIGHEIDDLRGQWARPRCGVGGHRGRFPGHSAGPKEGAATWTGRCFFFTRYQQKNR